LATIKGRSSFCFFFPKPLKNTGYFKVLKVIGNNKRLEVVSVSFSRALLKLGAIEGSGKTVNS
jgi:hypothetical protein